MTRLGRPYLLLAMTLTPRAVFRAFIYGTMAAFALSLAPLFCTMGTRGDNCLQHYARAGTTNPRAPPSHITQTATTNPFYLPTWQLPAQHSHVIMDSVAAFWCFLNLLPPAFHNTSPICLYSIAHFNAYGFPCLLLLPLPLFPATRPAYLPSLPSPWLPTTPGDGMWCSVKARGHAVAATTPPTTGCLPRGPAPQHSTLPAQRSPTNRFAHRAWVTEHYTTRTCTPFAACRRNRRVRGRNDSDAAEDVPHMPGRGVEDALRHPHLPP